MVVSIWLFFHKIPLLLWPMLPMAMTIATALAQEILSNDINTAAVLPNEYFLSFERSAKLVDIAYCISSVTKIEFPFQCHNDCSDFPNMTLIHQFTGDNSLETLTITGYIAIDHSSEIINLSLRGTRSFGDLLTDVDSQQVLINHICENCKIHKGFFETFDNTLLKVEPFLKELVLGYPEYQVRIMGHSLGGAISSLITLHIRERLKFQNIKCITLGLPILGNKQLADFLDDSFGLHSVDLDSRVLYRITNKGDTIPNLPISSAAVEYHQLSGEIFISNLDLDTLVLQDVIVCHGRDDFNCFKNFYGPGLNSHLIYFKKLGYCGFGFGPI